jgi:hypothetical protein
VQNTQEVFVPSHMYTTEGFRTAINNELAAGRTNAALPAIPGGTNLRVTSISPTSTTQLNVVMSDPSVTPSFPQTDVSYSNAGNVKVYEALNPASFDKVRSLQISCPGLAAGVHGSEAMAAQLGALNTTLREIDDTEFSRKLRDLYSMFKKGYDDESGQTLQTVADNAIIAETQMRAPIAVPPLEGDQSGRGELTPSVVAQAAMNLNDNPLAAQLHARRLLSTSQVADAMPDGTPLESRDAPLPRSHGATREQMVRLGAPAWPWLHAASDQCTPE